MACWTRYVSTMASIGALAVACSSAVEAGSDKRADAAATDSTTGSTGGSVGACSGPASPGAGCYTAAALVVCESSNGSRSICLSDKLECPSATGFSCSNACAADEYAEECVNTARGTLPTSCHAAPSDTISAESSYSCCKCSMDAGGSDARPTDAASACDSVDASDGRCVVCGGLWYCPANPPAPPCPNEGMGACAAGSPGCFTCQGSASVSYCGCGSDDGGVDDDGGDTDAGLTWSCTPAEFGCPEGV
jgi:hypothetical protein